LLASATSIDAAITALGSGMSGAYVAAAAVFTVVFSFVAVALGVHLGRYLSGKCPINLSIVGGVILIVLAITKLM
ncbi:MAG: manganese efflux pump MntP family protein, partial [Oscillospiraceae bacterium]|nr:manganese efflux pump MntP family protein [Oscillospiraceae bacterium]